MGKLECIKGKVDSGNTSIVLLQGDIVKVIEVSEGDILVEGVEGWCAGFLLSFTPDQIVNHFKVKLDEVKK